MSPEEYERNLAWRILTFAGIMLVAALVLAWFAGFIDTDDTPEVNLDPIEEATAYRPDALYRLSTTTTAAPTTTVAPEPTTTTTQATTTTTAAPVTTTAPVVQAQRRTAPVSAGRDWDYVADCESGDRTNHADGSVTIHRGTARWSLSTGNGYYGGLQFSADTWRRAVSWLQKEGRWSGPAGLPHEHSRETQIMVADDWLNRTDIGQWPECGRYI